MRLLRQFFPLALVAAWCLPATGQESGAYTLTAGERYGVNAAHRVDLYVPTAESGEPFPVVTLIGGEPGMPGGSRDDFAAAAARLAANGYAVVVASYRPLAELESPQGSWEMRDIAGWIRASLDQLRANRENYMMDEAHGMLVIAVGTGARHVASYIFDDSAQMGRGGTGIGAAVLISPNLDGAENPAIAGYYGNDEAIMASANPVALASSFEGPLPQMLIVTAQAESDAGGAVEALTEAICSAQPICPEAVSAAGDTADLIAGLGMDDSEISAIVDAFFAGAVAGE